MTRRTILGLGTAAGLLATAALAGPGAMAAGTHHPQGRPHTLKRGRYSAVQIVTGALRVAGKGLAAPPTTAQCEASKGIACYSPAQLERAYRLLPLYRHGWTGKGSTIVIVDSFGSPTAQADLHRFDTDFGLPDPPHFRILQPSGAVPPFDPTDPDQAGWGEETSLDIQWSHAIAPEANILLVETPVSETEGLTGLPKMMHAENYVIKHHLGDVITQSFGATENTFPSHRSIRRLRYAFKNARRHGVTVLASSGDAGPTDAMKDGVTLYTHRVQSWPDGDPLVTSVGGTQLHLDAAGRRTAPDNVWNESARYGDAVAGGGGRSHVFRRPAYQHRVRSVVGRRRGTPDISMSAAVDGGVLVYIGYSGGDGITPGYYVFGGTSEASPEMAGIVAIARQRAHHRLGLINPALYRLSAHHARGIVDITRGDNTVVFNQGGKTYTVRGFQATKGYDMASGVGTVNARWLTKELARR